MEQLIINIITSHNKHEHNNNIDMSMVSASSKQKSAVALAGPPYRNIVYYSTV